MKIIRDSHKSKLLWGDTTKVLDDIPKVGSESVRPVCLALVTETVTMTAKQLKEQYLHEASNLPADVELQFAETFEVGGVGWLWLPLMVRWKR